MSQAAVSPARSAGRYPIDALLKDLDGIPTSTDLTDLRRKSRDYFWYSPVLNEQLKDKVADVIATPRDEDEVVRIAAACARHRIPLTVRAGATGNYGQCVPLEGGVVLDITRLNTIEWQRPGLVRVQAGAKMVDIDAQTRPNGWELRMHPSTKRTATIGGFVGGGTGGVGTVTWGGLREPGNIVAARVVSVEEKPRVLDLRGDAAQKVNRAYGTTGIITALEMPLAHAEPWIDVVVAFDDFMQAVKCGRSIALSDGLVKKLVSASAWPLTESFGAIRSACPPGKSVLLCMIADYSLESFKVAVASFGGTVTMEAGNDESPSKVPLYEHTWNHTTLQFLKTDRTVTYLQCLFPAERLVESVDDICKTFGDELMQHVEFIRMGGTLTASGLPVLRYRNAERLNEIIAQHEAMGVMVANPHVVSLEDGSRYKRVDSDQLGFKHEVDPMGLLNPGKMKSFVPA